MNGRSQFREARTGAPAKWEITGRQEATRPLTTSDTGLGTTYERWALNRLLTRLQAELGFQSAFEGPGDGMTGIAGLNSLILGLNGVKVTLVLNHPAQANFAGKAWLKHAPDANVDILGWWDGNRLPFQDGEFELAWNFNILTRADEPQAALAELARVSRRWVLIFVPNRRNYGFNLHRLHHRVARQPWDHGRTELMAPGPWQRMFRGLGLRVRETLWIDCPWWPDIVDPGQLIADFFPPLKRLSQRARPAYRMAWQTDDLPYYRPADFPEVHRRMARLSTFETTVWLPLKQLFAHHVGVLAEKEQSSILQDRIPL